MHFVWLHVEEYVPGSTPHMKQGYRMNVPRGDTSGSSTPSAYDELDSSADSSVKPDFNLRGFYRPQPPNTADDDDGDMADDAGAKLSTSTSSLD